ncbi:MAG TPA: histidine kinase [bacterium]|nr:histidine kinase [bacterium]HMW34760.1 histidine kinase [bacterium]HMZ03552.1 histidine kinase [bacterium]HNB09374.1 histidine kinase [bacterium]HND76117.1 histidine kinase [bacterium]
MPRCITSSLFIALILTTASLRAQEETGYPYIKNYTMRDIPAGLQNWAVAQDQRGIMYFGNSNGLLIFDGIHWRVTETPGRAFIRSIAINTSDEVFAGAVDDLGYLWPDSNGQRQFVSLLSAIPEPDRHFGDVWKSFCIGNRIVFQTFSRIFIFESAPPESPERFRFVRTIQPPNSLHFSFQVRNAIYMIVRGHGLHLLQNDTLVLAPGGAFFASDRIYAMLPWENDATMIFTRERGIFLWKDGKIAPFAGDVHTDLPRHQIYHATLLSDSTVAIATLDNGIWIMNRFGRRIAAFDRSSGLMDQSILYLFTDRENNLWAGLNQGIARVEYPSRYTFFSERNGLTGSVFKIARHQGNLYVATFDGLYRLSKNNTHQLERVTGISSSVWHLYSAGTSLVIAATDGVYALRDHVIQRISDRPYNYVIAPTLSDAKQILVGHAKGVDIYRQQNGRWISTAAWQGIDDEIRTITEYAPGKFWLGTMFRGVMHYTTPGQVTRYGASHGLPPGEIRPFMINERLLFATSSGIMTFDKDRFLRPPALQAPDDVFVGYGVWMHAVDRHNFWVSVETKRGANTYRATMDDNGSIHYGKPILVRADRHVIWNGMQDDDGIAWFGGPDGIIRYDAHTADNTTAPFHALISRITLQSDTSRAEYNIRFRNPTQIPEYPAMGIRFECAATSFTRQEFNEFQYWLEGFNHMWSDWTTETRRDYTNLPEGVFTFRVRARNFAGQIGKEDAFTFRVTAPWHKSNWFMSLTAMVLVGFLIGAVRFATVRRWKRRVMDLELRERISRDLHDEIGANLSNIALLSEMLSAKEKFENKEKEQLARISNVARRTVDTMRDIIWAIQPHQDQLDEMMLRMKDLTSELLGDTLPYTLDFPSENPTRTVTMPYRQNIILIYKELLHNIIKHAQASFVHIRLVITGDELVLVVTDNGIGFDAQHSHDGGYGVKNLKRRTRGIRGDIRWETAENGGTRTILRCTLA